MKFLLTYFTFFSFFFLFLFIYRRLTVQLGSVKLQSWHIFLLNIYLFIPRQWNNENDKQITQHLLHFIFFLISLLFTYIYIYSSLIKNKLNIYIYMNFFFYFLLFIFVRQREILTSFYFFKIIYIYNTWKLYF